MALSVHQSSVVAFQTGLTAFSAILTKAADHAATAKFDPAVYMTLRLRPDMMPFPRQVQSFCDHAKNGSARLAGLESPRFADDETTIEALKARIEKTLAFIGGIDREALEAGTEREILLPLGPQKAKMLGRDYLLHFLMPNFYFHMTTAYDLLRYAGLPIGKRDFLGQVPGFSFV